MEESRKDIKEKKNSKLILKAVFITALILGAFVLGNLSIRLGLVIGSNSDDYAYAIYMAQ